MAIIGFIALVLLALYLTFAAGGILLLSAAFGGVSKESFLFLIPGSLAALLWYYLFTHAPFTISMVS